MGQLIFLVGRSGMGKSTSLRNLDENETVIVNTDQKALPFKQFNLRYNVEKGNYLKSSDVSEVIKKLKEAHKDPKIKTFVIDTWTRIMTDAVMNSSFRGEKGFEKWGRFSAGQYDLITLINEKVREDLIVYLLCHPDTIYDEAGFPSEQIAVQGKQLEKFKPESFSTIILYAEVIKTPGKPNEHVFRTITTGFDTCKTPLEMFESATIPNDLVEVNQKIREYYNI